MKPTIWATNEDGTIEFVSLTSEFLEGAIEVTRRACIPNEAACVAAGVTKCEGSMKKIEEFVIITAKQGASIVAIEKKSKRVIGSIFNLIRVYGSDEDAAINESFSSFDASKLLCDILLYAEEQCNLFERCNVDCLLEMNLLGILPEFRRRGIGEKMIEVSTELATKLYKGINVKVPLDGTEELSLEPRPKLISAIFSSPYTMKIGRSLNYEIAATVDMQKFLVNDKPLPGLQHFTLEFKKLE
ncbi:unnamed protein product [Phaedon cochleariae]|uniref:N-acetyltransferase domain-containing protein n=1 Tax=Phaedon cochleariae TaxID=80249 RepID=A0A9N9SIX5_PHACE|nr:unnamed protein product [Phaedon cochleariae]